MALSKEVKQRIVKEFGLNPNDSGSAQVQIALLSESIKDLTGHCKKFPKDASSRKGLLIKVCERKRFLKYLEKHDAQNYNMIINRLALKR